MLTDLYKTLKIKAPWLDDKVIIQGVSNCRARYDILRILGWPGVLFCTFVPMEVRKNQPRVWDSICEEVFKSGKQKLDDLVAKKCLKWGQLLVDRLKRKRDETTNETTPFSHVAVGYNAVRNSLIGSVLTDQELAIVESMTDSYTEKIMDHIGDRIALNNPDPTKTLFLSCERFRRFQKNIDIVVDLDPIQVYESTFVEPFPHSTVMTVTFFLNVLDNTYNRDLAQTGMPPARWISVRFKVRETLALIRDTSGAKDVFNGLNGERNRQLLLERTDVIFKLCGIEPKEIKLQFIKALRHRTTVDSGPLCLEHLAEDLMDARIPARSSAIVDFQRMEELHHEFYQLLSPGRTLNPVIICANDMPRPKRQRRR